MNFPLSDHIKVLLTKYVLKQPLSNDEYAEVEGWINASEANKHLLKEIESEAFLKKAILSNHKDEASKSYEQFSKRANIKTRKIGWIYSAASIAAIFIIGLFIYQLNRNSYDIPPIQTGIAKAVIESNDGQFKEVKNVSYVEVQDSTYTNLKVPRGGEIDVRLSEGTIIHLYSESSLMIPKDFSASNRSVKIQGEGYFKVAHDENSPFVVKTSQSQVKVLGTEFKIMDYGQKAKTIVTLVRGKVEVSNKDNKVLMMPNMRTEVAEVGEIVVNNLNKLTVSAVENGNLIYTDKSLEEIMASLSRIYDINIEFDKPELKDIRFTINVSRKKNLKELLSIIEKVEKVDFSYKENVVHIH
ncbi:FecR family protein [Plebeiibacterium sediminum]|uniref:FecR family protein n=1 Tax=Plebeiibacterium sediminum TaxID=2992112 RepID=A0AAE3M8I6_9BACT|nr:FecR family protein [Plebeiobacterium sediminum]MCW3788844.1 FecR family protein [Plebeiobacterium sediminum]